MSLAKNMLAVKKNTVEGKIIGIFKKENGT